MIAALRERATQAQQEARSAGQDPQARDAGKASTAAKIELNTAHKRHPLEAQGLARRVFRNDPAAQFITAESGERRAARYAEQWRDRATDLRAEAAELGQLPTEQAANRVQAKHHAAAEQAVRDRAERLRQRDAYHSPTYHQPGPDRSGPSLGL